MIVKRWTCPEHGAQETRLSDGPLARCALCGQVMSPWKPEPQADPRRQHRDDPRRSGPPRGETKPL